MRSFGWILLAALALVSCSAPAPRRHPVLVAPPGFQCSEGVAAAEGPALWLGPEWTYDGPQPVTFEVWASTNLVDWVLASNTVAMQVLFPPKPCEFYRVRTRDEIGQVSDWATTGN